MSHYLIRVLGVAVLVLSSVFSQAHAGMLQKDDLEKLFEDQYVVGEIHADLPVYPLFFKNPESPDSKPELRAYVFESNDIVMVRAYSGKPVNILVVIDLAGRFLSARLIDHKEPIFLDAYGTSKLTEFAAQYKGLSLKHHIEIQKSTDTPSRNEHTAYLRGVHRGTISVKAMNRTIMTAAAKVALAKLKINIAENFEARFADNEANGVESVSDSRPASAQNPPPNPSDSTSAEQAKSGNATAATDKRRLAEGAFNNSATADASGKASVMDSGTEAGNGAVKESVKESVKEAVRALGEDPLSTTTGPSESGQLPVPRALTAPDSAASYLSDDEEARREWISLWQSRWMDIAILMTGLCVLTLGLIAQKRFSANSRRFRMLRTAYLLFTLVFIGWYAQGQLTIVNVTAALESLTSGGDLSFLMNDPMTVMLWIFTGVTLLVWGRGTFCGWLCPFGALQELISLVANAIGLRQKRLRAVWDAKLKWVKYGVLATLLGSLFIAPSFAEKAVEIEPFKTAISFYFQRDWPYVAWAVACLLLGVFVYRGYCRYICPLGAALASVNFLQRWSWIPRREACGTPCQSCRHRCEYQAIAPTGQINYSECFQCLDCVSIYQDDKRCLPLIQQKKMPKTVIPLHPMNTAEVV
jgi:NosR/NirI family transcriptional regulator, nitrous oxide reductase regulator